MRYKCITAYDGTHFHGFQIQDNVRTVQEEIEKVLRIIAKKPVIIYPSGRTDARVHAVGQVFHFDCDVEMEEWQMKNALNSRLDKDIYIKEVAIVDEAFHARFKARKKEYHYLISLDEYSPFKRNYIFYPSNRNFDIKKMEQASKIFIGEHDFRAFTKNKKITDCIRTIYDIEFIITPGLLTIKFIGNGFLHNMVRILVAMLLEVGWGKCSEKQLKHILEQKNRQLAPKIAPPNGLYLFKVYYESENSD